MDQQQTKTKRWVRRKARIRSKISGTSDRLRCAVFRSSKYLTAQLIDDVSGRTLLAVRDLEVTDAKGKTKTDRAYAAGLLLAKKAKEKNISRCVFDRGGRAYHGRIAAFAKGCRDGGLVF